MMPDPIDYKAECHIFLRLKANGEKVTQAKYCQMRSEEIGKTVSLAYFKKVLALLKKDKKTKTPAKKPRNSKKETYDWESLKADFMAGPYRSVSQFCRERGFEATARFYRKSKGWRKQKSEAGLTQVKSSLKTAEPRKVEKKGDLTVRIVIRCPPGANIALDVQSTDPVLAAVEVPDGKA